MTGSLIHSAKVFCIAFMLGVIFNITNPQWIAVFVTSAHFVAQRIFYFGVWYGVREAKRQSKKND